MPRPRSRSEHGAGWVGGGSRGRAAEVRRPKRMMISAPQHARAPTRTHSFQPCTCWPCSLCRKLRIAKWKLEAVSAEGVAHGGGGARTVLQLQGRTNTHNVWGRTILIMRPAPPPPSGRCRPSRTTTKRPRTTTRTRTPRLRWVCEDTAGQQHGGRHETRMRLHACFWHAACSPMQDTIGPLETSWPDLFVCAPAPWAYRVTRTRPSLCPA